MSIPNALSAKQSQTFSFVRTSALTIFPTQTNLPQNSLASKNLPSTTPAQPIKVLKMTTLQRFQVQPCLSTPYDQKAKQESKCLEKDTLLDSSIAKLPLSTTSLFSKHRSHSPYQHIKTEPLCAQSLASPHDNRPNLCSQSLLHANTFPHLVLKNGGSIFTSRSGIIVLGDQEM